ncbi:uncharacterized protein Z518_03413 [Rhinocladiella mackenziei CBS 650.93]|uniref:Uncharacterized protein n=1 Tax=Rhinocladiella mackenziei CBS 650.93 TaxID=1442369 RepID=A0A0D2IZA7_9EURO|nr:uncharacterized protein Z518_03413 [Rhinocladiella mackenziei CBS 650.93]KIX08756.1 hypothetical protein Z518_03413 [Rhinocladiella mackenziei CBS 650.93]
MDLHCFIPIHINAGDFLSEFVQEGVLRAPTFADSQAAFPDLHFELEMLVMENEKARKAHKAMGTLLQESNSQPRRPSVTPLDSSEEVFYCTKTPSTDSKAERSPEFGA